MSLIESIKTVMTKYANFQGRARRSEFWWYFLVYVVLLVVLESVFVLPELTASMEAAATDPTAATTPTTGPGMIILWVVNLALLLPTLAVQARRLHDTGKSAWLLLLNLGCGIGSIILLFLLIPEGTRGPNQFGEDPKGAAAGAAY